MKPAARGVIKYRVAFQAHDKPGWQVAPKVFNSVTEANRHAAGLWAVRGNIRTWRVERGTRCVQDRYGAWHCDVWTPIDQP